MKTRTLVRVGIFAYVFCGATCALSWDARWAGACGGIAVGTLLLARASGALDRLLEPDEDQAEPLEPGVPIPTDPTPATPVRLADLEAHFAALDAELRESASLLQRRAMAAARKRDKVGPGPFELTAWRDLRSQLEDAS